MLIPRAHEDLKTNALVTGAGIVDLLSSRPYNIEELFQKARTRNNVNLEQFYSSMMLLWLIDAVDVHGQEVFLRDNQSE